MTDWEEIRKQFPVFKKYTYLNPAGGSPLSVSAADAGKRYFDEMLNEGDLPYDDWLIRTEETRSKLAALINATPSEVGFMPNTSSGMNIITMMNEREGEVLTMRDEFPSSTVAWINRGYKIRFVEPNESYEYPVERIEKVISPDTKILVTSYVQYRTGFRQDLEAVGKMCKKNNLIYIVNATQAIGVMPVDVKKAEIDFMAFSGLKWMTAGYGAGAVYIRESILEKNKLPFAGWQSTKVPETMDNYEFQIRNEASAIESGCPHFPSILALGGALDLINLIGVSEIHRRILNLVKLLITKIEGIGLNVNARFSDTNLSGIVIIRTLNAKAITTELARKNIIVSARGEGLRVSVSFFNNEADIDTFICEAKKIKELFFIYPSN